jgi:hypothetical protein
MFMDIKKITYPRMEKEGSAINDILLPRKGEWYTIL